MAFKEKTKMKPERRVILNYIAFLIVVSTVSALTITTIIEADSTNQGQETARVVFYVH